MSVQLPIHPSEAIAQGFRSAAGHSADSDGSCTLRVGDLAKRTGKTVRALHLYEELGLLEPADRSKGGYRLYRDDSVLRVEWIGKLQDMGFSLTDIRSILRDLQSAGSAPDAMRRVQSLFRQKLDHTREQLRRLVALEGELELSLAYLDTCETCTEATLHDACTACERHDGIAKPPELVAGFHPRHDDPAPSTRVDPAVSNAPSGTRRRDAALPSPKAIRG